MEKLLEYDKIEQIKCLLSKYDYFNHTFYKDDSYSIRLDGCTFGLEVKIDGNYKELALWGIERGFLYDAGMLLIEFAGKTFAELYKTV